MFNKYYESELHKLREAATEFAREHPVTAPLLMGPSMDPGAERMLEGVAFLSGLLNQKLDNEFQKFVKETIELIYPQFVRSIPATSIVLFEPKPGQTEPVIVKAKTALAANKTDGTSCQFQTSSDLEVHPLKIISAKLERIKEEISHLDVYFELQGTSLESWNIQEGLYLFLGGTYTRAANIYMLLYNNLKKIIIKSEDGKQFTFKPEQLEAIGMDIDNQLLDYPVQSFSAFRLLQEYFILPYKFFFMKLTGLDKWLERGKSDKFSITFELDNIPEESVQVNKDTFILNAVPVINLFSYEMDPITLNHQTEKTLLRPNPHHPTHYQVYEVESVFAYTEGVNEKKEYLPINSFVGHKSSDSPVYQLLRERSIINNHPETYLFFPYQEDITKINEETLVVTVKCTNGRLPEKLRIGDICIPTFNSPESLNFRNILQPTYSIEPPTDSINFWRFISYLSLNFLSLAQLDNLKAMLKLFLSAEDQDKPRLTANQKRISGISSIKAAPIDRVHKGRIVRGHKIEMEVYADQFAGLGDVYLFGSVLNSFFTIYASINTFIQFNLKELNSGVSFKWPVKIGNRTLI